MWLRIKNKKHQLKLGDKLKLGRIWFKIVEFSISQKQKVLFPLNLFLLS